jgi:hypothetical protein
MKQYPWTLYLLAVLLMAFVSTATRADDAIVGDDNDPDARITYLTLIWTPNSENNIVGYNVYYGRISGNYTRLETVTEATATIGVRGSRTVYFAVTAYNTDGLESQLSEEVHWP